MWQPSANFDVLKQKSDCLKFVRDFFYQRNVIEYDVPILGKHTVTDPYLDSLSLSIAQQNLFLQTSPEYYLKRALAAGSGDIFYLGKAFREDQIGRYHQPEFTMLEWYRRGFNEIELAQELVELVCELFSKFSMPKDESEESGSANTIETAILLESELKVHWRSYTELFKEYCQIDPKTAPLDILKQYSKKHFDIAWDDDSKSTWLDFLFTHVIEPKLIDGLYVVTEYTVEQAALAKIATDDDGCLVAKRFEVFLNGIELANGYRELQDPQEQIERFNLNQKQRQKMNKKEIDIDPNFMEALGNGLPECSGVAMGLDRLFMCLFNKKNITEVNSFSLFF